MGSNPKSIEMDLEEIDPPTDPNIWFRVVVRGWSSKNQQVRVRSLLALSNEKMVKTLKHQQDTLGPEEPGCKNQ